MFCPNCNAELKEVGAFCPHCGQKLATASEENARIYSVVIVKADKVTDLAKLIKNTLNVSLQIALKVAETLPLPLLSELTQSEAEEKAKELSVNGIVAIAELTENVKTATPAQSETKPVATVGSKAKALKHANLISAAAAILSLLLIVLLLFLPLYTVTSYETVDGIEVQTKDGRTLLSYCITAVESTIATFQGDFDSLDLIYLLIPVLILATMVGFIAATVKVAIPNIMQWIKPTDAKPADAKIKNSTLSQVFGFLLFFMIYIGYRRIVWASVIVILVAAFAEYLLNAVAAKKRSKAVSMTDEA